MSVARVLTDVYVYSLDVLYTQTRGVYSLHLGIQTYIHNIHLCTINAYGWSLHVMYIHLTLCLIHELYTIN